MGVDTGAERGPSFADASVQSIGSRSPPPEAAEIARALAVKLGSARVVVIGCVRDPIVSVLSASLEVAGIDTESFLAAARHRSPRSTWIELQPPGEPFRAAARSALAGALLVVDARLALGGSGFLEQLRDAVDEFTPTLLIDPDGGLGIEILAELVAVAGKAGLHVVHRGLVRSPGRGPWRRESPVLAVAGDDADGLSRVLSAGARGLALDPYVDLSAVLNVPGRICVASYEVAGPTRNGGIGTGNTSLALSLARAGHDVTLLFTGLANPDAPVDATRWERHYSRDNVHFAVLDAAPVSRVKTPHTNARRAYELYLWLREHENDRPFDIVHFPECQGHGYYSVLARAQGVAFQDTMFVAGVHSSTRWCAEANRELPRSIDALVDDHLERVSVELADAVISPSAYMIDYLEDRGWKLPARRFVQQYVVPPVARMRPEVANRKRDRAIDEVVFFGRLEVRKGIETFCDALDLLADAGAPRHLSVTFLGRPEHVRGEPAADYVERRAERWPWPHQVLGALEQTKAIAYLRRHSCLAVMPSTVDNLPNTVMEALSLRIPIITSRGGGIGELIDALDLSAATIPGLEVERGVPPNPLGQEATEMSAPALAERILAVLSDPVVPNFAIDHEANERAHVAWHNGAIAELRSSRERAFGNSRFTRLPRVTVGLLHRDEPEALIEAMEALAEQQLHVGDVVVVDDASSTDAARRAVAWAQALCGRCGWQMIRREHRNAGAARNQMVEYGAGELFVFLRPGEILAPDSVATIREVASRTRSDVLTWATDDPQHHYDTRDDQAIAEDSGAPIVVPIGGPPLAGLLYAAFSSGPYAITRDALARVRGFAADARDLDADQDLLNRALLRGCSLMVIPKTLTSARAADSSRGMRTALAVHVGESELDCEQVMRLVRPFAVIAPPQLADLPGLHLTLHSKLPAERKRALDAYKELDNRRHRQAEYIAYLEGEHRALSATVRTLTATVNRAPHRQARRIAGRVKRKLRRSLKRAGRDG